MKKSAEAVAFGRLMRRERESRGIKVAELAYRLQTSESDIRRWELGFYAPRYTTLLKLATAIGCSAQKLVPE
jgi:transcriptional regulator with XRE-family HTH domain